MRITDEIFSDGERRPLIINDYGTGQHFMLLQCYGLMVSKPQSKKAL